MNSFSLQCPCKISLKTNHTDFSLAAVGATYLFCVCNLHILSMLHDFPFTALKHAIS